MRKYALRLAGEAFFRDGYRNRRNNAPRADNRNNDIYQSLVPIKELRTDLADNLETV